MIPSISSKVLCVESEKAIILGDPETIEDINEEIEGS